MDLKQKLCQVAIECKQIADELASLISKLNLDGKGKALKSIRQTFSYVFNSGRIEKAKERLEACKNDLVLRIIVSLKLDGKLSDARLDERFAALDGQTRRNAELILDNRTFFTSGISQTQDKVLNKLDEHDLTTRQRHEETLATIATLRDWLSEKNEENKAVFDSLPDIFQRSSVNNLQKIQDDILECLWFPEISTRASNLEMPFGSTFSWIFNHDRAENQQWNDFSLWLKGHNGCYWINGKAASGKSTLMKYLSTHRLTAEYLSVWSGDELLFTSSFFFWYAGTPLQKSQEGLLRSILYDALSEYPELLPIVFPSRCRSITRRAGRNQSELSLEELREALTLLATQQAKPLKMCLLIDGIDEYQGDVAELANLLQGLGSEQTKLICSSRPIRSCISSFQDCPSLKLQDLTKKDIQDFAFQNLLVNEQMKKLAAQNKNTAVHLLVKDIVEKASGVFLWVALVTKSLMSGLQNFDTVDDLHRRLDELPSDLEQLYEHMLERMEPRYRQQASCLLQLMYNNSQSVRSLPMSALRLSFANEKNPHDVIDADIGELTTEETLVRIEKLRNEIQSCCCGLLEIRESGSKAKINEFEDFTPMPVDFFDTDNDSASENEESWDPHSHEASEMLTVEFIHKSVLDFLQNKDIWNRLTLMSPPGFDPSVNLASSCIWYIKTFSANGYVFADSSKIWFYLCRSLADCYAAEASTGCSQHELIEELDATMSWRWQACESSGHRFPYDKNWHWSRLVPEPNLGRAHGELYCNSMLELCCSFGLELYVEEVFEENAALEKLRVTQRGYNGMATGSRLQAALNYTIRDVFEENINVSLWKSQVKILKLSLEKGADPNETFSDGFSAWAASLGLCSASNIESAVVSVEVLSALVHHGADPNAGITGRLNQGGYGETHNLASPLWIIRNNFLPSSLSKIENRRIQKLADNLQAKLLALGGEYFCRRLESCLKRPRVLLEHDTLPQIFRPARRKRELDILPFGCPLCRGDMI